MRNIGYVTWYFLSGYGIQLLYKKTFIVLRFLVF